MINNHSLPAALCAVSLISPPLEHGALRLISVTNDKDFGELIFRSGQAHHGVLLLRLRDESAANRVRMVQVVLAQHADQLADHFTVATERGIRIRPAWELP